MKEDGLVGRNRKQAKGDELVVDSKVELEVFLVRQDKVTLDRQVFWVVGIDDRELASTEDYEEGEEGQLMMVVTSERGNTNRYPAPRH
jgi:hypothetical protein